MALKHFCNCTCLIGEVPHNGSSPLLLEMKDESEVLNDGVSFLFAKLTRPQLGVFFCNLHTQGLNCPHSALDAVIDSFQISIKIALPPVYAEHFMRK